MNLQYIEYDENWTDIKNTFKLGKRDGLMHYLEARKQNLTEEVTVKMVEQMSAKETGRKR